MSGPVLAGSVQFTTTVVSVVRPKVGAAGAEGRSATSVSVTVTSMLSEPPWPSLTRSP